MNEARVALSVIASEGIHRREIGALLAMTRAQINPPLSPAQGARLSDKGARRIPSRPWPARAC
jgi:hypothetical protein